MTAHDVSAIIPFFGDPHDTMGLIEVLRGQGLREIVVSDDHSPIPFPPLEGVRVVRSTHNTGFGSAVNRGARASTGDYLLILNSDLLIDSAFVDQLISAAEPWQPAVVSPSLVENGVTVAVGKRWPTVRRAFFAWLTPLARFRDTPLWNSLVGHEHTSRIPGRGASVDWVVGACMLIPSHEFNAVGGFDERFFMNSEEIDLQRRLGSLGVKSVVIPSIRARHIGGGSSDPTRRRQWVTDGMFIYASKWANIGRLAAALRIATCLNLIWNGLRRLRGAEVAPFDTARSEWALIRDAARRGRIR